MQDDLVKNLATYTGEVTLLKLNNGALVSSNKTLSLNSEKQLKAMASSINDTVKQMLKNFKKVSQFTYITNNFVASADSSKFAKEIPCDFKPFQASYSDSSYSLHQTISRTGFVVDSLKVPNKMALVFGQKKSGFLKRDNYVDINNSNPLMTASNIRNYSFTPEKKWWERTWVHVLGGAILYKAAERGVNAVLPK
jgi:hypothetical protein